MMVNATKKNILFSFIVSLCFCIGGSSEVYAQHFEGGILGGLNGSQVEGDNSTGYHKPGIAAGGFVQTNISDVLFLGLDLKYSQKGSRKNPDSKNSNEGKYIMRLGYIDMPLYLGIRLDDKLSVLGGVSAGYLLNAAEFDAEGELAEVDQREFNTYDIQAFMGLRLQLTKRLSLDLRGAYSLLPIRDLPGDEALDYWENDQFNNVVSTAIYYRIDY